MGLELTIRVIETGKMIVRVPGAFLDHSRTPKTSKIDQKSSTKLFGVPGWGYRGVFAVSGLVIMQIYGQTWACTTWRSRL